MRHERRKPSATMPAMNPQEALEKARGIAEAETIEAAWALFLGAMAGFGFARVNYGYTRYRVGQSIGDPADAMFLSSHALDRVRWFHESGLYLQSADYRWVRDNVGACSWAWVHEERAAGRLSEAECMVVDKLGRGRAGYTISFPVGAPRSKGAMGLAANRGVAQDAVDAHWAAHEASLTVLAHMAHLKLSQMPLPVRRPALTPRQSEILGWIADGKTLQDTAILTGLSLSSIEKHVRAMRERMGVETTAQAVAKAGFLNQLFVTGRPGGADPGDGG